MQKMIALVRANILLVAGALLFITAFFLIANPAGLYFLCDDFALIPQSNNRNVFQTNLLRPILEATLWIDARVWSLNATGFHITNLLLHLINSLLAYFLCKELLEKYSTAAKQKRLSFLVALLFLCYAVHSEPIFWIVGRGGSLAALFIQLSLIAFLKRFKGTLILSLCSYGFGVFTYELTWIVPLILTAFYFYEVNCQKLNRPYWPITLHWNVLTAYLFFRYFVLSRNLGNYEAGTALGRNYFNLAYHYVTLFARTFLPPMENSTLFATLFILTCLVFVILAVLVFKRSRKAFAFAMLLVSCVMICLLPAISLGIDTHDTESERYVYPATIFASMLIVFLAYNILHNSSHLLVSMALIITCHLYFLYQASVSYRVASNISRSTIESLNLIPDIREVSFINLPTQYKGALIFRIGFPTWAPGILKTTYQKVEVQSYKEVTEPRFYKRRIYPTSANKGRLTVDFSTDSLKLY